MPALTNAIRKARVPGNGPLNSHRILITAGPTHEPIDQVRFIGNRSSGRLGIELAHAAAARRFAVTLLLGPTTLDTADTRIRTRRFHTAADLQRLLATEFRRCDTLIMAAAVADYTPVPQGKNGPDDGKIRRRAEGLLLHLQPTPDLLACCSSQRRSGRRRQTVVGFALEPRSRLIESATSKLHRKDLDFVVANELETMEAPTIRAVVIDRNGDAHSTRGRMTKAAFSRWLLKLVVPSQPRPPNVRHMAG